MAEYAPLVVKTRRDQMYFPLTEAEIGRLLRFGEVHRFAKGDYLIRAGEAGLGMMVLLSGQVEVTRRDGLGHNEPIRAYRERHFIAEVASWRAAPPSSTPGPRPRSKRWWCPPPGCAGW